MVRLTSEQGDDRPATRLALPPVLLPEHRPDGALEYSHGHGQLGRRGHVAADAPLEIVDEERSSRSGRGVKLDASSGRYFRPVKFIPGVFSTPSISGGTAGGSAPGGRPTRRPCREGPPGSLPEAGDAVVERGDPLALGPDPGLPVAEVLDDQIDVRLLLAGPPQHLLDECDVLARSEDRRLALVALDRRHQPQGSGLLAQMLFTIGISVA